MKLLVKWAVVVTTVWFCWNSLETWQGTGDGPITTEELEKLAATVSADQIVIYTNSVCPYSAQAKAWMTQYGFKFTECNADTSEDCERQLEALTDTGVPYLIVRGHHMKDGFDSDEFIRALQ